MATKVGIRELRQNLSVYLRRVAEGERFIVTDRREPVAELGPPPPADESWRDRMIREGRLIPAEREGDVLDVVPAPWVPGQKTAFDDLMEERDEDYRRQEEDDRRYFERLRRRDG